MSMRDVLIHHLQNIPSNSNEIRAQAEQQLVALQAQPGYGVALAQVTLDANLPVYLRQLASISLKKYVKEHWATEHENFVAPQVTPEDKKSIKELLPSGLADPESRIRTAVGMAIASIAHWDWPGEWPTLVESLVQCLSSDNPHLVKGAMRCLDIFTDGDNLSDQYLPQLLNYLLPVLLKVFTDANAYTPRIRMRAISIVYSLMRWLSIIKEQFKENVDAFFAQVAPSWLSLFAEVLSTLDYPNSDCGLKIFVMKVLLVLVGEFPSAMKQHIPALIEPIWKSLVNGLPIYEQSVVYNDLLGSTAQDSEGEVLGFESLVTFLIEFFETILEQKTLRPILTAHSTELVYIVIGYMQMTQDQEDLWTSDPNQYVADEDDANNNYSLRISCIMFITELAERFGGVALKALSVAASKRLSDANSLKTQGNSQWWKLRESVVMAVGTCAPVIVQLVQEKQSTDFDVAPFIAHVLKEDLASENGFLRGRALWCASQFVAIVPADLAVPFLNSACHSLQSTTDPVPVKIGACRAIASLSSKLSVEILAQYFPAIIAGITGVLPSATEDTLHLVLDTVLAVVKAAPTIVAQYESVITPVVLNAWSQHGNDPLITDCVQDILMVLCKNPSSVSAVEARLLPVLTQLLNTNEVPGLTESAVCLLSGLVHGNPNANAISAPVLNELFPALVNLLLRTDDSAIMQVGATCLTAFVTKAPQQLAEWNPTGNSNGISAIIQVIAKLLSPALSEAACTHAGTLITSLITRLSQYLSSSSFMSDMLKAVVTRLQTAATLSLIQPLVIVFARLVRMHAAQTVEFLAGIPITLTPQNIKDNNIVVPQNTTTVSALHFVLSMWTKWHLDFQGDYYLKLSLTCLASLLTLESPLLDSIIVPGELIVDPNEGIRTRSRTKSTNTQERWNAVPVKIKILHLLVREYQVLHEQEKQKAEMGGAFEEDDDDDDEDEWAEDDTLSKYLGLEDSAFVDASVFFGESEFDEVDEVEDPDAKNDPIYNIDLKKYIEDFLRNFGQTSPQQLLALGQQLWLNLDKQTLQGIVNA